MFKKKGLIAVKADAVAEDELMDIVLSAGAEDMQLSDEVFEIISAPIDFPELKNTLQEKQIPIETAEISMIPDTTVEVNNFETARKILNLMEAFDDHDDIQNVYANFDIPEDILAQFDDK